jgi:mannose-6-phosphate isomerase-like protein (cupin superfamily)
MEREPPPTLTAGRNPVRRIILIAVFGMLQVRAQSGVDIYTAKDLQARAERLSEKRTQFAGEDLAKYGNHYTMLAHRESTGSSEVHEHEADIFVVESGEATIVTGGKVVSPHTEKRGEIRGKSIEGGERHRLSTGDIIHIPAGVPHQLLIDTGKPFTYFVVKVTGQ